MKLFKEFADFIKKGDVLDLAVGVVMGTAFGKIVSALTESVIMPIIGIVVGKVNVSEMMCHIGATEIPYGAFLQAVIDFLFTALAIFIMIKLIKRADERMKKLAKIKEEEEPAPAPEPSEEVKLLTEIRDLLNK